MKERQWQRQEPFLQGKPYDMTCSVLPLPLLLRTPERCPLSAWCSPLFMAGNCFNAGTALCSLFQVRRHRREKVCVPFVTPCPWIKNLCSGCKTCPGLLQWQGDALPQILSHIFESLQCALCSFLTLPHCSCSLTSPPFVLLLRKGRGWSNPDKWAAGFNDCSN